MSTTDDFIRRAHAKHGGRFDYSGSRYAGFQNGIEIVCPTHGPFQTTPKSHMQSASGGCPKCRAELMRQANRMTTEQFITRARKVHDSRYDYRFVDCQGNRSKVTVICPRHGPFRMKVSRHLEGRGCRKCAFERIGSERRLSFWDFVERVEKIHGACCYEYKLEGFVNAHSKIPIHCPRHGTFYQHVGSHLKGHGCPRCVQSKGEEQVRSALQELGVEFSEQVRFPDCRDKRPLPFDFWVPASRLLIEFDGRQHYDNSELWGGEEKLAEIQRRDVIKNSFAAANGYRLLRISYWDYENIEAILLEELAGAEAI